MYASNVIGSRNVHQFNYGDYKIFLENNQQEVHMLISIKDEDFTNKLKNIVKRFNETIGDSKAYAKNSIPTSELTKIIKDEFGII